MTGKLERIAAVCAIAVLALAGAALLGYALHDTSLYAFETGSRATSPLTALGLGLLAAGLLARLLGRPPLARALHLSAIALALCAMASQLAVGHDALSPLLAQILFASPPLVGATSIGTALCITLLGLAGLPILRSHPSPGDGIAATALFISGLVLIGHAYGAVDLYAFRPFHTMALTTATAIALQSCAFILSQGPGGWAHNVALAGSAGRATRRQLLVVMAQPVLGFALVWAARHSMLELGTAMALLVVCTLVPMLWLILRDGRILVTLEAERRDRADREAVYLSTLEERLGAQAAALELSHARQIGLAETATRISQDRYRILFDSIDAGFCVIEMLFDEAGGAIDYRFLEVNAAFEKHTGLRDAQGWRMRHLAPDHEEHWFETYGKVARNQQPIRFELPAARLDNRWYDVHAFPVDEPSLRRVGILFNDITERREIQRRLEEMNATLEQRVEAAVAERELAQNALRQAQKMEAMGQLTGGVAHDFNNLLTPIIGSMDLISRRGMIGEREQRMLDAAMQSAERARVLVQRLLAFARRQPLQPGPVDVAALVASMGGLMASTLGAQIRVVTQIEDGLPPALADANQLEMAILNLSVNARDAMPEGGTLTISATTAGLGARADVAPDQFLLISVRDTGTGMDAATLGRATEPFYSTKGIGKGTGLGLSMVDGLAAQLGGTLEIQSTPGLGTRVDLYLPVTAQSLPLAATTGHHVHVATGLSRGKALLVDDEAFVRMATADMVEDLGYDVLEAADASEALAVLEREPAIDLVITDHLMPGMTGSDLARDIRQRWPAIRVLLVSGYADAEGVAPDIPRLAKPFRQSDLAEAICELT